MEKYFGFILLIVLIFPFKHLLVGDTASRNRVLLCYSLALTLFTVFYLNDLPAGIPEEQNLMQNLASCKRWVHQKWPGYFSTQDFLTNNFVFINTAKDQALITNEDGDSRDSTVNVITNRQQLTQLFNFCNKQSTAIDLIICDISFKDTTTYDDSLKTSAQRLIDKDKLIFAFNPSEESNPHLTFNKEVLGSAKVDMTDQVLLNYHLVIDGQESIAHLAYSRLQHLNQNELPWFNRVVKETNPDSSVSYGYNTIFPEMVFTESDINNWLIEDENLWTGPITYKHKQSTNIANAPLNIDMSGILGRPNIFKDQLAIRKTKKLRNIVIIGAFGNTPIDMHVTSYGPMHGTSVILNVLYHLLNHHHLIQPVMIIWTFIFFYISLLSIVKKALHLRVDFSYFIPNWFKISFTKIGNKSQKWLKSFRIFRWLSKSVIKICNTVIHFFKWLSAKIRAHRCLNNGLSLFAHLFEFIFIEEGVYWLIALHVLLINLIYDQLFNLMGLVVFFIAFKSVTHFLFRRQKSDIVTEV